MKKRWRKFLSEFSQEEIDKMARTFSEGYRIGFVVGKKDLSKKKQSISVISLDLREW